MGDLTVRRPATSAGKSLQSYAQRAAQRMTKDEAVKAMMRMLSAYPTFRCSAESMVTLAEVLLAFPLEIATAASSPIHGVPKACKDFPPTAGQIIDWCEREGEHLCSMAKLEISKQRLLAAPPPPRLSQADLDAQFERLGLAHLRSGSKAPTRQPRFSNSERMEAQAILDRCKQEAAE